MNSEKVLKMMADIFSDYRERNRGVSGVLLAVSQSVQCGYSTLYTFKYGRTNKRIIENLYNYVVVNNLATKAQQKIIRKIESLRVTSESIKPKIKKIKPGTKIKHNNKLYVVAEMLNSHEPSLKTECEPISAHRIYNNKVLVNTSIYIDGNYSLVD